MAVRAKMYDEICASCHGLNGHGIEGLAPPLMNSERVAVVQRSGLIILHGIKGLITVNNQRYDSNLAMHGLIGNEDIAGSIAYVTNAFSDVPKWPKTEEVIKFRRAKPKKWSEYTEEELLNQSGE